LYVGLALLDCYFAGTEEHRRLFESDLLTAAREFSRVDRILREIVDQHGTPSSSSDAVIRYLSLAKGSIHGGAEEICSRPVIESYQSVFFPLAGLAIGLRDGSVSDLARHPRLARAVEILGSGKAISHEEFFALVWGHAKYSRALHENLIFGVQQRLKTSFSIRMSSSGRKLSVEGIYVVR
jgi:hypothetical protein